MSIRIAKNNMMNAHITNNGTIEKSANYDTTETSANRDLSDSLLLWQVWGRYPSLPNKLLSALLAVLTCLFLCVAPLAGCTSKTDYGQYTAEPGSEYQTAQNDSADSESLTRPPHHLQQQKVLFLLVLNRENNLPLLKYQNSKANPILKLTITSRLSLKKKKSSSSFESYSDLDYEGRCGNPHLLLLVKKPCRPKNAKVSVK